MANNRFMSNLSNSDTSLWLHNKLGTSNDLWSDTTSIVSQLSGDVLRNIRECFVDLQSQVKLKLLLSFLHISRRNVEQWRTELEDIIEVGVEDSDQWVSMLAELMKNYPKSGTINFQLNTSNNSMSFNDLVIELRKLVRKHGDKAVLPLECLYLNKNALTANVGQMALPVKHFALKRKPKSATLRAELLQKSSDAANGRRNSTGPSVAIRCRGLTNDSTPLKGIPSRNIFGSQGSGFKTPSNPVNKMGSNLNNSRSRMSVGGVKRDGGIKLLDITEQPLGRDAKRRKKVQNEENDNKNKDTEKAESEPFTPDYAAGLTSTIPPSPAPPSYAPPATPAPQPTVVSNDSYSQIVPQTLTQPQIPIAPVVPQRYVIADNYVIQNTDNSSVKTDIKPMNTMKPMTTSVLSMVPTVTQTPQLVQQLQSTPTPVQPRLIVQPQQQQQQQQTPQPQQPFVRRQLQLSREQMLAAQEMFNNSNKVTRPEKALILGFMAGSRENPCPQLGNVVTIKLSEREEDIQQTDGTVERMVVETHFQMNYSSGEWKKVQKLRKFDQNLQNSHTIQTYQTLQQSV